MHDEYRNWSLSDSSQLLYIQGKPGSGKSTLTKYFNNQLPKRDSSLNSAIVAKFFYSYKEDELQKSHYNMLQSILYDILQQDEAFFLPSFSNRVQGTASQYNWYKLVLRIIKNGSQIITGLLRNEAVLLNYGCS